jgi:hypothetical protein
MKDEDELEVRVCECPTCRSVNVIMRRLGDDAISAREGVNDEHFTGADRIVEQTAQEFAIIFIYASGPTAG